MNMGKEMFKLLHHGYKNSINCYLQLKGLDGQAVTFESEAKNTTLTYWAQ